MHSEKISFQPPFRASPAALIPSSTSDWFAGKSGTKIFASISSELLNKMILKLTTSPASCSFFSSLTAC